MSEKINIFNSSSFKYLPIIKLRKAITNLLFDQKKSAFTVNVIYLNNKEIHEINKDFLNHNYPTDVITFEIEAKPLLAEIYIGVDIALEQSKEYNVSLQNEILRLGIHGALHLCGYNDKTSEQQKLMTQLENKYLDYARKNS